MPANTNTTLQPEDGIWIERTGPLNAWLYYGTDFTSTTFRFTLVDLTGNTSMVPLL